MIKTVSFAPPRSSTRAAASSKAPSKAASKTPASRGASGSLPASTVANSKPATVSAAVARASLQKSAAKTGAPDKSKRALKTVAPVATELVEVAPEPIAPKAAPKAKRSRVPKDLAQQYGASETEKPRRIAVEAPAPRKRRTKEQREARSQLLRPDDEVLQRLQQAQSVAPARPIPRRARGWRFECGHCGRVSRFETPAALCDCGAIAVRE